jgi:hypothetical protein
MVISKKIILARMDQPMTFLVSKKQTPKLSCFWMEVQLSLSKGKKLYLGRGVKATINTIVL